MEIYLYKMSVRFYKLFPKYFFFKHYKKYLLLKYFLPSLFVFIYNVTIYLKMEEYKHLSINEVTQNSVTIEYYQIYIKVFIIFKIVVNLLFFTAKLWYKRNPIFHY